MSPTSIISSSHSSQKSQQSRLNLQLSELNFSNTNQIYSQYIFSERGILGHNYYYINDFKKDIAYTFRGLKRLNQYNVIETEEKNIIELNCKFSMLPIKRKSYQLKFNIEQSYEFILHSPYLLSLGFIQWRSYELEIKHLINSNMNFKLDILPIGNEHKPMGYHLINKSKNLLIAKFQRDYQLLKPGTLFFYQNLDTPICLAVITTMAYICAKVDKFKFIDHKVF